MKGLFIILMLVGISLVTTAQTRLLRNPSISQNKIAFIYAGDVWIADKNGSNVARLTAFEGVESEPHFSPDGQTIAFTGQYDGNTDVFIVPITGGEPKRLTWHPAGDFVTGWANDGQSVIFASGRSQAPYADSDQLWQVSIKGSTPTLFMKPRAVDGKFSPDGKQFVYERNNRWESEFRNYRGGQNTPLRILNLQTFEEQKIPMENSRDMNPVWMQNTIYFLSDRDLAMNVWSYNTENKAVQQLTFFKEFDCKSLEGASGELIFENGGYLYTLKPGAQPTQLPIEVKGDFPWARTHWTDIDKYIQYVAISPHGKRLALEARGEIITIPAKKGDPRNLSNSQGVADRAVAWSPDGKSVSWFSDEGGEYQLVISDQFGENKRKIPITNPTFYYEPSWSPDSKYISFYNENRTLWVVDVATGMFTEVDNEGFAHPQHVIFGEWSPDSKWLAYTKRLPNEYAAIFIYSLDQKKSFQITDGMSDCVMPAWDKSGKYVYFLGSIDYGMNVGWLDMSSYDHPVNRSIYAAVLSKDDVSPLAPESDDETVEKEKKAEPEKADAKKKKSNAREEKPQENKVPVVKVDIEGISRRIIALPVPARPYVQLKTAKEGVILYTEQTPNEQSFSLNRFTMEKRKAEKIVDGILVFTVAAEGEKYVYLTMSKQLVISNVADKPKPEEETVSTANVKIEINPLLEWKQMFREAWRYQRDYFYVDNVHGLDLDWAYKTYGAWVDHVKHRSDMTYVLDILGGETSIGHSFVGGGDYPDIDKVPVGLLGADYATENGRVRIKKIYNGESWNATLSAPISGPGINVKAGDYLIAVNGTPIDASRNVYSYFDQTADKQTRITVSTTPDPKNGKDFTVIPVKSESQLRQHAWVEGNRKRVDSLSNGKLAYVWLPNTGGGGYANFNRYYFAQKDKKGAVIDERFNHGGSIADYIVDLLARDLLGYFNNPIGTRQPFTAPNAGIWGPKVMIINEGAGSGGDMLPYMFKMRKVGTLVGTKTWGGLVGIWDVPGLVDGGYITAPRGGFYNLQGEWDVENKGIAPDVLVEQDPKLVRDGHDPQLEKAVEVAMEQLKTQEVKLLPQPKDPIRVLRPKQ